MTEPKAVGVREVAAVAGVSRQTVSRVVNEHPSIRPETRERVLAVIDQLGYRPNRAARMLGTKKSRTIGVVLAPNSSEYGPASALQGISLAAAAADYIVHTVHLMSLTPDAIAGALNQLLDVMVEGLIIIAPQTRLLQAIDEVGLEVPYVFLQARPEADPHALYIDQVAGARIATRHLLEHGHRVIAHIAGPQEWLEADARMRGYLDELSHWDVDPLPPILGDWTAATGYRIGQALAHRHDITAIFASNDSTALGVLHALHEAGVRLPDQMSVVGFDDIPIAAHAWPPLTTIRQDFTELGRRCVAQLVSSDEMDDGVMLTPALITRQSSARANLLPN